MQSRDIVGWYPAPGLARLVTLQPLKDLLSDMFSEEEFRIFVHKSYPEIVSDLPGLNTSLSQLIDEGVNILSRHGRIDTSLFEALLNVRPARWENIYTVRRAILGSEEPLEERPHEVQKLDFYVDRTKEVQAPAVLLTTRGGDEYEVRVVLDHSSSIHELDRIKIVSIFDRSRRPLPLRFSRLPEGYASLGSWRFYESIARVPELVAPILEGLRDAAWNEDDTRDVQRDKDLLDVLLTSGGVRRPWHVMSGLVVRLRRHLAMSPHDPFVVPEAVEEHGSVQAGSRPQLPRLPPPAAAKPPVPVAPMGAKPAPPQPAPAKPSASHVPPPPPAKKSSTEQESTKSEAKVEPDGNVAAAPAARPQAPNDTVTLSIDGGSARLVRGLALDDKGDAVWTGPHTVDWKVDHFVVAAGRHTLDSAMKLLPTEWARKDIEAFGDTLATLLFGPAGPPEAVRTLLRVPPDQQRRLVLVLDEASFRAPWEYLRIDGVFLAEQRLSIVRHVAAAAELRRPLKIAPPRTVLIAYANPLGDFVGDRHRQQIIDELNQFPSTGYRSAERCTAAALERLLTRDDGQVFHFLGHGEKGAQAGLLVHGAKDREAVKVPADRIATWVGDRRRDLVVLGACFSGATPGGGVMSGVGMRIVKDSGTPVVAMQMAVPQEFSTAFVARFYRELRTSERPSEGPRPTPVLDIEVAVYLARRAEHERRSVFGIPVLLADARAIGAMPDLQPVEPGWAQFMPIVLTAGPAASAWDEAEAVPPALREAIREALQREASQRPDAVFPLPPRSPGALRDVLAELLAGLSDDASKQRVTAATARPAPEMRPELRRSTKIAVLDDLALRDRVAPDRCKAAVAEVEGSLSFPPGLVARMIGELLAGKHVLLAGPVGTGKTSLARQIVEALGYSANLETASADWTRFEVQGGFWPAPAQDDATRVTFTFRPGVFVEAVLANWHEEEGGAGRLQRWRRQVDAGATGTWLILDELNRADMDRALGGVFTALETRRLRVQVNEGTTEIPIPEDFRVIATINGADRHFLFRLSDALKRRFAFVHVPVTTAWGDEWARLEKAEAGLERALSDDLRRFVALVRVLHPLGTALVQSAWRFLAAARRLDGAVDVDRQIAQAIGGSILPNLEDVRREGLVVLHAWATSSDLVKLGELLQAALPPPPLTTIEPMLKALATLPMELVGSFNPGDERCPPLDKSDVVAAWVARRVGRPSGAPPLPELGRALAELVSGA